MQPIRLIATDLDGTIIGSVNEVPLYTSFRDRIDEFRRDYGASWVVCTGRSLRTFRDQFTPMQRMGAIPNFIIIRHAYVYGLTPFGYLPHVFWNLHIHYHLWLSLLNTRSAINEWHGMVSRFASGVTTIKKGKYRLWLRFDSEETASSVADILKEEVKPYHHLRVFKYLLEVDVRLVPFTKGLAVTELAQHLDVEPAQILAIGNGHNDISMLEGKTAKMTGCPANSEPEVKEVVHLSGGHIAGRSSLGGVMEILDAYKTGNVRSELPADWQNPAQNINSRNRRAASPSGKQKLPRTSLWVMGATTYIVLLVFAIYIPFPFSGLITKPFWLLMSLITKLVFWLTR